MPVFCRLMRAKANECIKNNEYFTYVLTGCQMTILFWDYCQVNFEPMMSAILNYPIVYFIFIDPIDLFSTSYYTLTVNIPKSAKFIRQVLTRWTNNFDKKSYLSAKWFAYKYNIIYGHSDYTLCYHYISCYVGYMDDVSLFLEMWWSLFTEPQEYRHEAMILQQTNSNPTSQTLKICMSLPIWKLMFCL